VSEIYEYKDGDGKTRKGDPLELMRRLFAYCHGDYNELLAQLKSELPEISIPAGERLATAACLAFRLPPPWNEATGEGTLESVWNDAVDGLIDFIEKKESPAVASPTSPPPTESASSPLATMTSLDSTSTSNAP
jgi:hypothetical protein